MAARKTPTTTHKKDCPDTLKDHPFYGMVLDPEQEAFRDAIWDKDKLIVFCNARAGTGKTTVAVGTANMMYEYGRYDGIIVIMFPCEENRQGYLPGSITEKSEVYFEPINQAIIKCNLDPMHVVNDESLVNLKNGDGYIKLLTSTFLRGTNFENKVVIVEESQNGTVDELKKVLTRCSDNCKVVVIGHTGQCDLRGSSRYASGFEQYIKHFRGEEKAAICELKTNHRGWISTKADELDFY